MRDLASQYLRALQPVCPFMLVVSAVIVVIRDCWIWELTHLGNRYWMLCILVVCCTWLLKGAIVPIHLVCSLFLSNFDKEISEVVFARSVLSLLPVKVGVAYLWEGLWCVLVRFNVSLIVQNICKTTFYFDLSSIIFNNWRRSQLDFAVNSGWTFSYIKEFERIFTMGNRKPVILHHVWNLIFYELIVFKKSGNTSKALQRVISNCFLVAWLS